MGRIVLWLKASEGSDLLLLGLLGEEDSLNVWQDTTLGNGDFRRAAVLLLSSSWSLRMAELKMTQGDDPGLVVVVVVVTGK